MSRVPGSVPWKDLKWFGEMASKELGIPLPLKPHLNPSWRTKIGSSRYSELWVRYYSFFRHYQECMACASDWSNHMAGEDMPIVRGRRLDLKLLLANSRIQRLTKEKQTKRTNNNGQK